MELSTSRDSWNTARFDPGSSGGHYESWFQRANHPTRRLAFWIRYTIFRPSDGRHDPSKPAIGELWAIFFDGEKDTIVAVKEEHPIRDCGFAASGLDQRIATSRLDAKGLIGAAETPEHRIAWDLKYSSPTSPILMLPKRFYEGSFPKAKALVGSPNAVYAGTLTVDGEAHDVTGWVGSQNHNWGSQHTDMYAWGQVAGFDGVPDSFLECSTARVKLGPIWTPWMVLVVLSLDGELYNLNGLLRAVRAKGAYDFFTWAFDTRSPEIRVQGTIAAARTDFIGLTYWNPPGGHKTCLNSKIARCELTVTLRGQPARKLSCAHRTAFEILTDREDHGVPVLSIP